jgi:glycosyltransferase involved in cell wall biosynthesis
MFTTLFSRFRRSADEPQAREHGQRSRSADAGNAARRRRAPADRTRPNVRSTLLASSAVTQSPPEISVIIPCLNEEHAVGTVVDQALDGIRRSGRLGEVVVVDNGSTDASAAIASERGATVVSEPRRGYGSAYLAGLEAARGEYLVMADADDTYPLSDLPAFVERLESGDDLVIGSRFKWTIHGDAMPFLNRFVGNPVLTGMLNVLFGVKVSDAHCGMRALRRETLPVLDLHSTGMEFASEMVFKAYRRGLAVSEIPIDYYPRVGESKLNRFGDAWRHVRFMLLYSPSWLYLVPGSILLLLGLVGMLVLATGPNDILGHTWQIHTMLGFVALTLIGAQVIQLGVFARTYARVRIGERDRLLEFLGRHVRLEHGLLIGGAMVVASLVGLGLVGLEWAANGFGALGREYETALLVTELGLGIQIVFGAFFLALLTMPLRREPSASAAMSSDLA